MSERIDILFIGDSITEFWLSEGKEVWQSEFSHLKAQNEGIAGDTTVGVLTRLDEIDLEALSPRLIVLLIGTNDISIGVDAESIAKRIEEILEACRRRSPDSRLVLMGILPRGRYADDPARYVVDDVNQRLAKTSEEIELDYLNIKEHFLIDGGDINLKLVPDYLHLSMSGYEVWASCLRPLVEKCLGSRSQS